NKPRSRTATQLTRRAGDTREKWCVRSRDAFPGEFGDRPGTAAPRGGRRAPWDGARTLAIDGLSRGADPTEHRSGQRKRITDYRIRRWLDAMDHPGPYDLPHHHSFHAHLHDAIREAADCLSFPQAGARPADDSVQPD